MATNTEIAKQIVEAYISFFVEEQGLFLSYGELAIRIGREDQHRFLGAPLNIVMDICDIQNWPDIATMIVDKPSFQKGTMKPSEKAIEKYGGWHDLRLQQARVIAFDWSKAKTSLA